MTTTENDALRSHSYDPANGFPRIMPALRYEDVGAAIAWLSRAFGLKEHLRWADEHGAVQHAEMRIGTGYIELASASRKGFQSPKRLGAASQSLVLLVDDVDAHYRQAHAAGAKVLAEPANQPWGLRQYSAEDPEGHRWEFSQHLRDVPPAEWGAQLME
ncbi:MAG: VOC family protein [Acidobacteriaceae bacterium]